jgi:MFS family permease
MPWKTLNLGILAPVVPGRAARTDRPRRGGRGLPPPRRRPAGDGRVIPQSRRGRLPRGCDVSGTFLRWTFLRAVFHRGYVLVSGLYFVLDAHLAASRLLLLGTVASVTLLVSDLPTGVWSDAVSRKWPLVAGHMFLAGGMVMTGLVTAFPLLVVTQLLWGVGWGFSSGADVAWVTDELARPGRIDRVLAARARWDAIGSAMGMVAFGLLGWAIGLAAAVVASGAAMAAVGLFVAARFTEDNFTPAREHAWKASLSIVQRGIALARRDHQILLMLAATMLINGASMVTWLFPRRLVDLGFPDDPVLWYTALGIVSFAAGAAALRIVEARIDGAGAAGRAYALACVIGVLGLIALAYAPDALLGGVGVVLASGVGFNVTRAVSVIWVNRRTTSDVRATVHSFLSQAECAGEIISGFALAILAQAAGITAVLLTCGAVIAVTGAIVSRARACDGDGKRERLRQVMYALLTLLGTGSAQAVRYYHVARRPAAAVGGPRRRTRDTPRRCRGSAPR